MFKVTIAAADQIRQAVKQGGAEGMALRLAATTKADGGLDYRMGFDEVTDEDISFKTEGVEVVMEPEYVPLLDETTLDYVVLDGEEEPQFIFINPKDPNFRHPGNS
ncbi:MAG: iron-sulfur cluster assembly accessory protein [Gammaproteobacteria bacterium]|nr:iron-sulfur cluster assembly accessory protein [Gammaproteobacteria bacterium]